MHIKHTTVLLFNSNADYNVCMFIKCTASLKISSSLPIITANSVTLRTGSPMQRLVNPQGSKSFCHNVSDPYEMLITVEMINISVFHW